MASGQNNNAGGDGPLLGWTSYEESQEKAITSYVDGVITRVINCGGCGGGGYETAADVFVDYQICAKLLIKLIEQVPVLRAASFAKEYLYYYAKRTEAKMLKDLGKFVTRPFPPHMEWALFELKEELDFFMEVEAEREDEDGLSHSQHCINDLDANLMDDNLKRDVIIQRDKHSQLCHELLHIFQQSQNTFQAYLDELDPNLMNDNAQRDISMHIQSLKKSCQDVKNDLSKKWAEVRRSMDEHHLVRKEKEEYEKAIADHETECLRIRLSSGLIH